MDEMIRVRSVAVVAAAMVVTVMCTLVVTHAWSAGAAPGDTDSTFVPTGGCRLVDTRPAPNNVGDRAAPLFAGDIFELAVRGSNGGCTAASAIPTDAVAVALNVTAVNATATSNIRLYPANLASVPLLSNLNVTAGAPAVPNKVDVKLSPDGEIRVFNEFGSVNVIIDVVGYYTNSTLQELSQRVAGLEAAQAAGVDPTVLARLDALDIAVAANTSDISGLDAEQTFAVTARDGGSNLTGADIVVATVTVTAPVAGQVTVNSTITAFEPTEGDDVRCSISTGTTIELGFRQRWKSPGILNAVSQLAGTRTLDIAGGATDSYHLVCHHVGTSGGASVFDAVLTAIFTPAHP